MKKLLLSLSVLVSAQMAFGAACAAPTITLAAGSYASPTTTTVTSACTTTPVTICTTNNGATPVALNGSCSVGTLYTGAITLGTYTLKAAVASTTKTTSPAASSAFTITVPTPTTTTQTGTYNTTTSVTWAEADGGATIHTCTGAGADCTPTSSTTNPVSVTATGTHVCASASETGINTSAVQCYTYTLQVGAVSCLPAGGSFSSAQSVTCSIATTTGATVNTCQDPVTCVPGTPGATPTVSATGKLFAQGVKASYASDAIQNYSFTIGSAVVGLSVSSHDYGTVTNLTNSAAFGITISNTGSADATISEALGGTNAGDFTISGNTCTGTLVATTGTCVVSVVFNPSNFGSRAGTLTVTSNDPVNPSQVVTLAGTGAWPAAAQCTVGVAFTPSVSSARSGTLSFATDASTSPDVATLSGTGGGPPSTLGTITANFHSISPGRSLVLSWTASGDTDLACSIDQGVGSLTITDPNGSSGTKSVTPTTAGNITYTMTCTSSSGSVAPTATVFVTRPVAIGP